MANEKLKTALAKAKTLLKSKDQDLINILEIFSKVCDTIPDVELTLKVEEAIAKIEDLFKQQTN